MPCLHPLKKFGLRQSRGGSKLYGELIHPFLKAKVVRLLRRFRLEEGSATGRIWHLLQALPEVATSESTDRRARVKRRRAIKRFELDHSRKVMGTYVPFVYLIAWAGLLVAFLIRIAPTWFLSPPSRP